MCETASILEWPVAAWIVVVVAGVALARLWALRRIQAKHRSAGNRARRRLLDWAARLKGYADAHLQVLPTTLDEMAGDGREEVVYHPVPRLNMDARLVLLHDGRPVHQVIEFPNVREGRGVVLCSGRFLVLTEPAFEKLMEADRALRERLGLAQADADLAREDG